MITRVVLAKLSPTMEEGTIVKWLKAEGDAVKVGDVLAEIETDKANMEMEALADGVLRKILTPAGGKAPVGALIGVIAAPGEDIAALVQEAAAGASSPPAPEAVHGPAAVATPEATPAVDAETGRVKASPLARAMAARGNLQLASVAGSGPGGRIVKRDIEAYLAGAAAGAAAPAARAAAARTTTRPAPTPSVRPGTAIPLTNMRRTIAKRLAESKFSAPHFYVSVEVDMAPAASLREQLLRAEEIKVSYNDLVIKACARALAAFPLVNASWTGEAIQTHAEVHVGVAVALPEGLITPVVRHADRKGIIEISQEVKELAARARDKRLKPEEFSGSTFTISNLGMFEVTEFTAIINPPEACILAVGAVRKVPVVVEDRVAVGQRMKLTLSSDHRVVDGALAAQFLAEVRRLLENPAALLL